jgi:hypothetical protein
MKRMESLLKINYSKRYNVILTEHSPIQRYILNIFKVEVRT